MNSTGNGRRRNNRNRRVPARQLANTMTTNLVQPRAQRSLGVVVTQEAARMQMDPIRNGIRVRNREIVKTISRSATTGAFPFSADAVGWRFMNSQTTQPASPGAGSLGPYLWLGQLATLYDKFIIRKLHFEFIPSLPFTSTGQVAMYWDSDPDPIFPSNFQQVSGNVYAKAVQISQPCTLAVRPNQVNRLPQYQTSMASGSPSADTATAGWLVFVNQDGSLSTATTGVISLGTIWVDYEIEFLNPGNPTLGSPALARESDDPIRVLQRDVRRLARQLAERVPIADHPKLEVPDLTKSPAFILPSSEQLGPAYKMAVNHTEL
nr:MAG: putative coat protein [Tombusviridae sp.]